MIANPAPGAIGTEDVDPRDVQENNFAELRSDTAPQTVPRRVNNDPRARQQKNGQPRRDRRDVHGWVILDKPIGMTSTQAVAVAKRLFNAKRAGHAGTLDPLASGGLPIALGEATKTVPFVMDGRKRYRFTVCWG
ncbi:MAG: tRNA pseudouridine(55) synthase TruB, partial [Bradyrhizobium guangdongense]